MAHMKMSFVAMCDYELCSQLYLNLKFMLMKAICVFVAQLQDLLSRMSMGWIFWNIS